MIVSEKELVFSHGNSYVSTSVKWHGVKLSNNIPTTIKRIASNKLISRGKATNFVCITSIPDNLCIQYVTR